MRIVEATEIVLDLASQQWGLVTTAQAKAAGVSAVMLSRLVDKAVISRVRFGVYAAEAIPWTPATQIRAQWLALEPRTLAADRLANPAVVVVSHESAAELHQIGDLNSHGVHFTVPARRQTRQPDVVFHLAALAPQDWVVLDGLPVTTPLRTIKDLARAGHEPGHLTDMIANLLDQHLATREEAAGALVEVAGVFGISPANRAGVDVWMEERFPVPRSSAEEVMRRQMEAALAPLREQLRVLAEKIAPPSPPVDLPQDLFQDVFQDVSPDPGWQELTAYLAAALQAGDVSSRIAELLQHPSGALTGHVEGPGNHGDRAGDQGAGHPGPGGQRASSGDDIVDNQEHHEGNGEKDHG